MIDIITQLEEIRTPGNADTINAAIVEIQSLRAMVHNTRIKAIK
jgi:hypothetical protein